MEIDFDKYPLPKRLRHHTSPNLYFSKEELTEFDGFYPPTYDSIDWKELFINGRKPDALDIGCGKGAFLFDFAEMHPDINILGIEVREALPQWINGVVEGYNVPNCAAIWYSVVNGLKFIEENSINYAFYLFPDPWPKKKHLKRRAFNNALLDELHRVMPAGGKLHLTTDVESVHDYHEKLMAGRKDFTYKIVESDEEWQFPQTNKEKFCRRKNIPFMRIIATNL